MTAKERKICEDTLKKLEDYADSDLSGMSDKAILDLVAGIFAQLLDTAERWHQFRESF